MITKEELREIPQLHKDIKRKQEQLLYLREKATSIPSIMPDPNKVQTSPSNNVNKYSDAAVDLAKEIWEDEARLHTLQSGASLFIMKLPTGTETEKLTRRVMTMRYLRCYTWEEIADLTGYVVRWVQQIEWDIVKDL